MENFLIAFFKAVGIGVITYVSGLMLGITTITLPEFAIFLTIQLLVIHFLSLEKDDELYRLKKKQ